MSLRVFKALDLVHQADHLHLIPYAHLMEVHTPAKLALIFSWLTSLTEMTVQLKMSLFRVCLHVLIITLYGLNIIMQCLHQSTVPIPVLSFVVSSIPYNGTIFTLTGVVHVDQSVDTNITIMGLWSMGSGSQEVTTLQHQISLLFQPLSSDSSEEYTLTVTVKPSINSVYITESNYNSATYNLTVQGKLM